MVRYLIYCVTVTSLISCRYASSELDHVGQTVRDVWEREIGELSIWCETEYKETFVIITDEMPDRCVEEFGIGIRGCFWAHYHGNVVERFLFISSELSGIELEYHVAHEWIHSLQECTYQKRIDGHGDGRLWLPEPNSIESQVRKRLKGEMKGGLTISDHM